VKKLGQNDQREESFGTSEKGGGLFETDKKERIKRSGQRSRLFGSRTMRQGGLEETLLKEMRRNGKFNEALGGS